MKKSTKAWMLYFLGFLKCISGTDYLYSQLIGQTKYKESEIYYEENDCVYLYKDITLLTILYLPITSIALLCALILYLSFKILIFPFSFLNSIKIKKKESFNK